MFQKTITTKLCCPKNLSLGSSHSIASMQGGKGGRQASSLPVPGEPGARSLLRH